AASLNSTGVPPSLPVPATLDPAGHYRRPAGSDPYRRPASRRARARRVERGGPSRLVVPNTLATGQLVRYLDIAAPSGCVFICISLQDMVEAFLQGRILRTAPLGKAGSLCIGCGWRCEGLSAWCRLR